MQARFATERAIAPELMTVATVIVENERGHETYQPLGWEEPSRWWQTRKPHDFGSLLVFQNEDGSTWQAKPEKPRSNSDGKTVKYETPKGHGSRAYLPAIDAATRQKIASVQGCEVPLEGVFWDWVAANPEVPIVITEGAGKALCLLSHGWVAIALTGVDGGVIVNIKDAESDLITKLPTPKLLADLPRFLGDDRRATLAFDADSKLRTYLKASGENLSAESFQRFLGALSS
jgi:Domain of unknown function (DUF3854)